MKKIGRYDIVEELGRGAMGVVYKASDPKIGRLVAIKILSLNPLSQLDMSRGIEMFMREARAAGRLSHPGIVTIHDALEDPETHAHYIVMEFVPGQTLEHVLQSGSPMEIFHVLSIVRQVAEALEYAHNQNVIHRDLKPANILLTDDGRVKITDFGIAKFAGRVGTVRTDSLIGTPSYMSPEQVTGGKVDARSDMFSLGIIFYTMLTGQRPFAGDTAAVMFKIAYEDPPPPGQLNSQISRAHDYIVLRCLAKDPDKRYGSASAFLDDLEDLQHGRPPRSETLSAAADFRPGDRTALNGKPSVGPPAGAGREISPTNARLVGATVLVTFCGLVALEIWMSAHRRNWSATAHAAREATSVEPLVAPPFPGPPRAQEPVVPAANLPESPPLVEATKRADHDGSLRASRMPSKSNPRPAPEAASVSTSGRPSTGRALTTRAPATRKLVQLVCKHDLAVATLTISSGTKTIFIGNLRGKKRGGIFGIKSVYSGTLARALTVPDGADEISVRVASPDGSTDLSSTIPAVSLPQSLPTLNVVVNNDHLSLTWGANPGRTP